jgi:hypothetical protein
VKLVATASPQFIAGIGELGHARRQFLARNAHFPFLPSTNLWQPVPSIQRMLHTPHTSCVHVRFFPSDRSPSAGFASPGPPSTCLKSRTTEIPLFSKTLSRGTARARARAKSRSFDHPLYSAHVNARKRNPDQPGQSGAKPVKQPLALTSPTWVRGVRRVLREGARPRGEENREKQNSSFSPKPCQEVAHARARVGKIRLFDQPYNPRMLTQESVTRTNQAKAEAKPEPGGAITLRNVRGSSLWPLVGLSAMGRMLGATEQGIPARFACLVKGAKRLGAIHRLWPVPPVTGARAWFEVANCGALRCVVCRWMGTGGFQKLSRGKSRGIDGEPEI